MAKNYSIGVWDVKFFKYDDDGNELNNADGSIKLFDAPKLDMSTIADYVDDDDLVEVQS